MRIEIKILNKEWLPRYQTPGSAAMDLVCTEDVIIYPGETKAIHTGLAIWIGSDVIRDIGGQYDQSDLGYTGLILPRSGLGTKGLILANTIGVIDEDYQGELIVQAWNRNPTYVENGAWGNDNSHTKNLSEIKIKAGERFCQLMLVPVITAQWNIVEEFSSKTSRNTGAFGSSGK